MRKVFHSPATHAVIIALIIIDIILLLVVLLVDIDVITGILSVLAIKS
jgi:hypothetical protein